MDFGNFGLIFLQKKSFFCCFFDFLVLYLQNEKLLTNMIMPMKKMMYCQIIVAFFAMLTSCQKEEPNPQSGSDLQQNSITRPQDSRGKIFLENGVLVEAGTTFDKEGLANALGSETWVLEYGIYFDNHKISGKIANLQNLPSALYSDRTATYTGFPERIKYSVSERVLQVEVNPLSSTFMSGSFTVVAVDYTNGIKRLVMDHSVTGVGNASGYDPHSVGLRTVWIPLK